MRTIQSMVVLIVAAAGVAAANETREVDSRIERISLFKNGLCVVHRVVKLPGPGEFVLKQTPQPVHGTFFVASRHTVQSRIEQRMEVVPADEAEAFSLADDLAGQAVQIVIRDAPDVPVTGRVVATGGGVHHRWDRSYEQRYSPWWAQFSQSSVPAPGRDYLVLATDEGGRVFVDPSQIVMLRTEGPVADVKRPRPRLVLRVADDAASGADGEAIIVRISYLTKGMAWAPAYHVDLTDPASLHLQQSAVLRNELEDLENVPIELVSGFPSMVFSHVLSPLAPEATWSQFFQQLGQEPEAGHALMLNVARQAMSGDRGGGIDSGAAMVGERADLHYQSIGRISLAEGESLHLDTAGGKAGYDRIVEWSIPDTRDEDGRRVRNRDPYGRPVPIESQAWDAVRFNNPLNMPMTTAPATLVAFGRFLGQQMSTWVSPGQQTLLRITKALSITTRHTEQEQFAADRDFVHLGGHKYREVMVEGTLDITNRRNMPVTMVVHRQFSGALLNADDDPEQKVLETGVYSDNPRNELTWTLDLEPHGLKTLTYKYKVLVRT